MKKYTEEWHHVNDLLSMLRGYNVVALIDAHYREYGNSAPAQGVAMAIVQCQGDLDRASHCDHTGPP